MKLKFKVGDRVKVVGDGHWVAHVGHIGTIVRATESHSLFPYEVQLDNGVDESVFSEAELQLADNALKRLKKRYETKSND